jgi:hypothetical protein
VQGVDALRIIPTSGELLGIDPGMMVHDQTNEKIYYRFLPGESLPDLHLEASIAITPLLVRHGCSLADVHVMAAQQGSRFETNDDCYISNYSETMTVYTGLYNTALGNGNVYLSGFSSQQPIPAYASKSQGGGILCGGPRNPNSPGVHVYGGWVKWTGDDAYQTTGAGRMYVYGSAAWKPYGNGHEPANDQAGGELVIEDFVCYGAGLNGYRDQAPGGINVGLANSVFIGSGSLDVEFTADAATESEYIIDSVCTGLPAGGANIEKADEFNADLTTRIVASDELDSLDDETVSLGEVLAIGLNGCKE